MDEISELINKRKSGALAAGLNLVLPGLGYIYCGMYVIGLLAFPFFLFLMLGSFFIGLIPLWGILVIDGFLAAGRYNKIIESKIQSKMKICSQCSEMVLPKAKVCKHCGHTFSE